MSCVQLTSWLSLWHGKNFKVGHYSQTSQPDCSYLPKSTACGSGHMCDLPSTVQSSVFPREQLSYLSFPVQSSVFPGEQLSYLSFPVQSSVFPREQLSYLSFPWNHGSRWRELLRLCTNNRNLIPMRMAPGASYPHVHDRHKKQQPSVLSGSGITAQGSGQTGNGTGC